MKYCEKCGNELKEGYAFCDKCGAKVEQIEKKKEKNVIPTDKIIIKTGKGKIIFLTILNIILLASTITFLVLWLTKPEKTEYKNYSNKKTEEKKETNQFLGKWEQTLEYKSGSKVVQSMYEAIEFKENHTFKMTYYDKDNKSNTIEEQNGTYSFNGNIVNLEWIENGKRRKESYSLNNNKLCLNSVCSNYLFKNGYGNKIVVQIDEDEEKEEIKIINYSEYNKIINNGEDAIVVIIKDGCIWCEKFESVVEELQDDYTTPIYYYKYDNNIDVAGTPSTIIIKNGIIINMIEGYKELNVVEDILDSYEIK